MSKQQEKTVEKKAEPKIDMEALADRIRKRFEDRGYPEMAKKIGTGSNLYKVTADDCVKMPGWFQEATKLPGIPFGRTVVLAGPSDSGKTSFCIAAMKAALDQGHLIVYVETEGKTSEQRLLTMGVDPKKIGLVMASTAEQAYEGLFEWWNMYTEVAPDKKVLVLIDSIGNVVSQTDQDLDLMSDKQAPGGHGKINRLAVSKMVSRRDEGKAAIVLVSYTYAAVGKGPMAGNVIAGGAATNFYSSLTFTTGKGKQLTKQIKGEVIPYGREVWFRTTKNHVNESDPGPPSFRLHITSDGISYLPATKGGKKTDQDEDGSDQKETSEE